VQLARLKEWREARGFTQAELAEAANTSEHTIVRAEHRQQIRVNTAKRVADVLGVSVADLLEKPPVPLAM
jgi:transcriptional regulator with XRE-family HTH domain